MRECHLASVNLVRNAASFNKCKQKYNISSNKIFLSTVLFIFHTPIGTFDKSQCFRKEKNSRRIANFALPHSKLDSETEISNKWKVSETVNGMHSSKRRSNLPTIIRRFSAWSGGGEVLEDGSSPISCTVLSYQILTYLDAINLQVNQRDATLSHWRVSEWRPLII